MPTLYVSDLDGTLLRSNERTSEYTNRVIRSLTERGMLFSYATARSYVTASKVTQGLDARIPLIVYNGTMVIDNATGALLLSNFFGSDIHDLLDDLIRQEIYPIVYSFQDGTERFSYLPEKCTPQMLDFLATRKGDRRDYPVHTIPELHQGEIFYITCIGEEAKLAPMYHRYRNQHRSLFQRDIYSGAQWLEFMPQNASKSHAAKQLKKHLQCDRLVVFGDGANDLDLFQESDDCYAVENAVEELKQIATAVIGGNNDDGVAKWLEENWKEP